MKTLQEALVAAVGVLSLGLATIVAADAGYRGYRYHDEGPAYSYGPYYGGGYVPRGPGYYGSESGPYCEREREGHISRYSCEYRY
jgi:hypothetical protein